MGRKAATKWREPDDVPQYPGGKIFALAGKNARVTHVCPEGYGAACGQYLRYGSYYSNQCIKFYGHPVNEKGEKMPVCKRCARKVQQTVERYERTMGLLRGLAIYSSKGHMTELQGDIANAELRIEELLANVAELDEKIAQMGELQL